MIGHNLLQRNSLIVIGYNFNTTSVSLVTQASSCDNPLLLTWLLLDSELWYDGEDDVQLAGKTRGYHNSQGMLKQNAVNIFTLALWLAAFSNCLAVYLSLCLSRCATAGDLTLAS